MKKEFKHPIRVAARLTGLTPHVIRAWERRYQAVTPFRTSTNRRLYTEEDIERLRLMKLTVDGGRRISDVANLSLEELRLLTKEDSIQLKPQPIVAGAEQEDAADYLSHALDALDRLDKDGMEKALKNAAIWLGNHRLRKEVIAPLMHAVGDRWRDGRLRIMHEHLVSALVRSMLAASNNGADMSQEAPKLILTTPAGEHHELGALLAASAANDVGWNVVYLGPNLPADEIVLAAREFNARAVGVSIVYGTPKHVINIELSKIRSELDPNIDLLVGGRSAAHFKSLIADLGAIYVEDLSELQQQLENFEK
jgi:DNA-binding transcriptional MerR regulator/methylmalonyl-CoA mutase cobalamin-binding subunit